MASLNDFIKNNKDEIGTLKGKLSQASQELSETEQLADASMEGLEKMGVDLNGEE